VEQQLCGIFCFLGLGPFRAGIRDVTKDIELIVNECPFNGALRFGIELIVLYCLRELGAKRDGYRRGSAVVT